MQALFWKEAGQAKALPIHRYEGRAGRPDNYAGLDTVRFVGPQARLPEEGAPSLIGRSFRLKAKVDVPPSGADGVLFAIGGRFGGLSWYIKDGRPALHYNLADVQRFDVASDHRLAAGRARTRNAVGDCRPRSACNRDIAGGWRGRSAAERYRAHLPFRYTLDETLDVGSDEGTPVTEAYAAPFNFTGVLQELSIEFAATPR